MRLLEIHAVHVMRQCRQNRFIVKSESAQEQARRRQLHNLRKRQIHKKIGELPAHA